MIFISLKRLQTTATIHKANKKFKASHLCGLPFFVSKYVDKYRNVWYNMFTTFLTIILFYDTDN